MSAKMLKSKSSFTKRRLTIIFILCTIIAVSLMTGFSGLNSDNTKHSAVGQRICMYADVPTDGSTPEDHDLISNVQYAAQRLYMSKAFRGNTTGKVIAELGAGLTYTQNVYNRRVVKGDKIFTESISSSTMKSVAEQKYINGTRVLYRPSTSVSGKTAKFGNSVKDITKTYGELYGLIPNELTKQVLSVTDDPEKDYGVTIKSVRDNNAKYKAAALASPDSEDDGKPELGFDVPSSLVKGADGNFKVTLTLEPVSATLYSRNETRTMAGSAQNPDYSSESEGAVSVTIVIDEEWYPISVTVVETYGIEIKGIGAMICHSSLTEVFAEIGNKDIVLPEQEFFESHMADIGGGDIPPAELEASDYLMYAFGKYISGTQNLDLSANISIGDTDIKNLKLSVNIGTMNIRARYGDLFIEYGKGGAVGRGEDDLVYITLNSIKGYLPVSKATGLIDDPSIKTLMSMFTTGITLPDLDNIIGDDFMSSMTFEKTDSNVFVHIPLKIEGLADIDATITLKNNEDYDLVGISGTVDALGQTISLNVKPAKNISFVTVDKSYVDLSPVVDFVPAAISTVLDRDAYGINGSITVDGKTIDLDAYIARDGFKSVAVDATVAVFGQELSLQYVNDTLYASIGNVGVKAATADIPSLIDEIGKYVTLDTSSLDKLMSLMPQTIGDWISVVKTLAADEHEIALGLRILGAPITITLTRDGNLLTGFAVTADVDVLGIKLNADIAFDITTPDRRDVTAKEIEYIDAKEIPSLIPFILDYATASAFDAELNGKITVDGVDVVLDSLRLNVDITDGVKLDAIGSVTALGQTLDVAYVDDTVYVSIGNIKFRLSTADIDAFIPPVERLLNALGVELDLPQIEMPELGGAEIIGLVASVLDAVKYVSIKNNTLVLEAEMDGGRVYLTVDVANGKITLNGALGNIAIELNGSLKTCTPDELDISVDGDSYCDLAELVPTIDAIADFAETKAIAARIDVSYDKYEVAGTLSLDLSGGLDNLKLGIGVDKVYGIALPDVRLDVAVIAKTAYVRLSGNINIALSVSLDEIPALLDSLGAVIPADVIAVIENALGIAGDLEGSLGALIENSDGASLELNDIRDLLDRVLSAVTLSVKEGYVDAAVSLMPLIGKDIAVTAAVTTDLTRIAVDAVVDGTAVSAKLLGITPDAVVTVPEADYIAVSEFKPIIDAVIPVALADGFEFKVDVDLFGVNVEGDVIIALPTEGEGLAVKASLMIADLPLDLIYKNDAIYLDLNSGEIMISCGTTKEELDALVAEVTEAVPQLGEILEGLTSSDTTSKLTLDSLMNIKAALYHTERGMALDVDLSPIGFDAKATVGFAHDGEKLNGLTLDVSAFTSDDKKDNDIAIDIDMIVELDDSGALRVLRTIEGATYGVNIEITSLDAQTVSMGSTDGYLALSAFTDYLKPIMALVNDAATAKSLTLNIDAYVLTDKLQRLTIDGTVELDLDTMAIRVGLTLLDEKIEVTYYNGVLYIKLGEIRIKFTVSGEVTDLMRIHAILKEHLPAYLSDELAVLLGIDKSGTSALSDIGLIIDRFSALAEAQTITDKAALLFGKLHDYDGASSAVKTLLDKLSLYMRNDTPTIGFNIAKDTALNISPFLTADRSEIAEITIDTAMFGMTVYASVGAPELGNKSLGIAAPENSESYVSIIDYVELINNIYHTFTTHNEDDDITFVIDSFNFTYKQNDTVVKNADGSETVTEGKTIAVKSATDDNGNALPVLKGKFVKTENDTYDINLEAHLTLSGLSDYSGDVTLGLYVLTNYTDEKTNVLYDKVAFLCYKEANGGYGENVSIDYGSVMQILASALKILGVSDKSLQKIIPAEYRVDINSDVFAYMDINGLDSIRGVIDDLVNLVINAEYALKDINAAWEKVNAPEQMTDATREQKIDALLGSLDEIKEHIATALNRFKNESEIEPEEPVETEPAEITEIQVPEFSDIVNGITLTSVDGELGAKVKNELTTGGDGLAQILVSQGKNAAGKGILNGISIQNLDVNTALLNAEIDFTAGCDVTIAPDMGALINVTDENDKTTYSNFSNIKHLLFDVLNTANMMEFEIGGYNTSDSIDITLDLSKMTAGELLKHLASLDISIKYNIQVKIIDCGKDKDGKAILKTAAMVELFYENCTANVLGVDCVAIPNCVTRLYFFDNVLYVQGVSGFDTQKDVVVGNTKSVYECTRMTGIFKFETYFAPERDRGDYKVDTTRLDYVYAMYTVDEFFDMIKADMSKFLNQFLFYLVPLSKDFTIFHVNLQSTIADAMGGSGSTTETPDKTIAKIFKGYSYDNGKHSLRLGLGELTGSSALSDLDIAITGQNHRDDSGENVNLKNNYISNLYVKTTVQNELLTVKLNATLRNTAENSNGTISSNGLSPASAAVMNNTFKFDGHNCFTNGSYFDNNIIYTLDGTLYNNGGTLYAKNSTTYGKASYVSTSREWITNFSKHPDYGGANDSACYDNFTYTLTNAYELSGSPVYYVGVRSDGTKYVYTADGEVQVKSLTDTLLAKVTTDENGKIISVQNRSGGIQWSRPWAA